MNPFDILKQRGIYEQAIKAGWRENNIESQWEYPVYNHDNEVIATRSKAYDSHAKKKYGWIPSKPENPESDYYVLPGTLEAIKAANGVAYLANGEASVLAMKAADIGNVIATCHGETTIPKSFVAELELLGISKLINIPDKDEAGRKGAIKLRDFLRDSGVEYQVKQWPDYLPEKADFNDLWIHIAFDKQAALESLESCQTLILPQTEVKPKKVYTPTEFDKSGIVSAIHKALESGNYTERKVHQGVWLECHCPFHDDKQASAGFNLESGVLNCMGQCGRAFSPKELARHFGIDIASYFPKQEGKKKPKKADLSHFETVLDTIPADTRSYADILADEIMGRELSFESGQYLGFGQWEKFPLAILSAVMTLSNGRSSLALFLGRLHTALLAGQCKSVLSECELVKLTQLSRNTVLRAILEAEHLGFVQILRGINNIDSIPSKVSGQNPDGGRPTETLYLIEWDAAEIKARLGKMLEIFYLEKHAKKALAMPSMQMARQLETGEDGLRIWQERVKAAMNDAANKEAKRAFDTEMFGNGSTWKGWVKALETQASIPLDYYACTDSLELRAAILKWWVVYIRQVNSREELCRLLGCTDPVIDKVMEKAGIISEKQTKKVDILKLPTTVKGMAYEWSRVQRELHGKSWRGGFWDKIDNAWIPFDTLKDCLETYSRLAGRITKAYMLVQCPSVQRLMTEIELAERAAQSEAESPSQIDASAQITPKTAASKADASERKSNTYQKWDKHSYVFLYRQLQLLVHCFSQYRLVGYSILDKKSNVITSGELPALWAWFQGNASAKPVHKVKSFYGKDYDEDVDFAELQALADERKTRLGISETIDFAEDVASLPIFDELPKQGVMYAIDNEFVYVPF